MATPKKLAEFPDVEAKLQKPTKQSAFEKQKAEAEAKRLREAAETAAVYEDFVKSFERDDGYDGGGGRGSYDNRGPPQHRVDGGRPGGFTGHAPYGGGSGAGKRHFGIPSGSVPGVKSGPGSLGPAPPAFGKKRAFESFQQAGGGRRDREEATGRGLLAFDDDSQDDSAGDSGPLAISKAFDASDDEVEAIAGGRAEEKAIARPTLRLANMPPNTSPAVVKALIPANLLVENVKILPPTTQATMERKSVAAIVTLSAESAATEIDAAVSSLQNRYLGFGFYLSLHRHLSSVAISGSLVTSTTLPLVSHPFGARAVAPSRPQRGSHRPIGRGRGFAPPSSYSTSTGDVNRENLRYVPVQPLKDIKQLRMIHKVIEGVLQHGPEFEALLMSRPDVQREEKWAWIWDARSAGGIWYRWRLWEIVTGNDSRRARGKYIPLFEGSHAWKAPDQPLAYEYTTTVDEFVSGSEYNSEDDDEYENEVQSKLEGGPSEQEDSFLNPIDKAKLTHLLARLPQTLGKIRKGDIARITTFAIMHASRGAAEIVNMIVSNVERPFAITSANPEHKAEGASGRFTVEGDSRQQSPPGAEEKAARIGGEASDTSAAKLLGLYVVSDILSSSATSGVRHAWRFRLLFESALRARAVFESLGAMAERSGWGRLRAEKWKRSVGLVLGLWEGWCVFPAETQEFFVRVFENPPQSKIETEGDNADDGAQPRGRWKTVDASGVKPVEASSFKPVSGLAHVSAAGADDENEEVEDEGDVEYYTDDEELDREALDEEDIDGEPILERDLAGLSMEDDGAESKGKDPVKSVAGFKVAATVPAPGSRKRMRAVDMFAGSDSEAGE